LVILPLAGSLLIFSNKMAEVDRASRIQVLEARLDLLVQHIEASWEVSSRVGFAQSEFYQKAAVRSLEAHRNLVDEGEASLLVVDQQGRVLLGPPSWEGHELSVSDPWRKILESDGQDVLPAPHFADDRHFLTVHRRFGPWGWGMATFTDQQMIWRSVTQSLGLSILGALGFLALAIAGFWVFARQSARPFVELKDLASRMGLGQFDLRARVAGPEEVATLAREWNEMADRVEELTTGLEKKVAERTKDLAQALEQTKTIQSQLILAEKMASLGQLVAGIAHEINTPLAAIGSARSTLDDLFGDAWPVRVEALAALSPERRQLLWTWVDKAGSNSLANDSVRTRRDRKELSSRLDKAGVLDPEGTADRLVEVGLVDWSPQDLSSLAGRDGRALVESLTDLVLIRISLNLVGIAVAKAERVIGSLKIYSRHDSSREATLVSLAENIDLILPLFQNYLRGGIELVKELPPDLFILADADRMGQLWANLIGNALGAMGGHGRLEIRASQEDSTVVVRVIDSGTGIVPEDQPKIFTPFFTTKKPGEGSGLGLSICQTIVQEAKGSLTFTSVPGRTVFEARFPCP
jgi:signal transduction histidine kinase